MDTATFWRLRDDPLHDFGPAEWEAYYPQMAPWLLHADPEIRDCAVERLSTAVFWAEGSDRRGEDGLADIMLRRTIWLLETLDDAHRQRPDILPAFLKGLRWTSAQSPAHGAVMRWLSALSTRPAPGGPDGLVEGTILLREDAIEGESAGRWMALLDHPSDYVRGCAAYRLAASMDLDDDPDGDDALLAEITTRERERPGVAGPFWSGWSPDIDTLRFDPVAWMIDIVETRSGPEPVDMPFNGIDFHLHELAGDSAPAARRLLDGGNRALALEAATEVNGEVEGMREVLRELGRDADAGIANRAHQHLATCYNEMHPGADPRRLRHLPGWMPGVDAFVLRQGDADRWREVAVFYPAGGLDAFDDALAWRVIDAALPPPLRGERVRHFLALHGSDPAPYRMGDDELHAYASGALVTLSGGAGTRRWRQLDIIGRGLQGRWAPFDWTAPDGS